MSGWEGGATSATTRPRRRRVAAGRRGALALLAGSIVMRGAFAAHAQAPNRTTPDRTTPDRTTPDRTTPAATTPAATTPGERHGRAGVVSPAPGPRSAEERAARRRAHRLFEESTAAYDEGDFERAAALLRAAYDDYPEPVLLYNLGQALEAQGDLSGARDAYRDYLEASPDASDRAGVERRLATLEGRAGGATAATGGEGLVASAAIDRDARSRASTSEVAAQPTPNLPSSNVVPALFVLGSGVAILAFGTFVGATAKALRDDADDAPTQVAAHLMFEDAKTRATMANVSFAVGGAVLAGGATWLVVELLGGEDGGGYALRVGPGDVALRLRF